MSDKKVKLWISSPLNKEDLPNNRDLSEACCVRCKGGQGG